MDEAEVRRILEEALRRLEADDRHLLENDLSERCIAARLAMYMQPAFNGWSVDVEYNRKGDTPKRLGVPEECANAVNEHGEVLVVPDLIVHRRGPQGPNLLVIELKKTTNTVPRGCDRRRVDAFRAQLRYSYGALVECETRRGPSADRTAHRVGRLMLFAKGIVTRRAETKALSGAAAGSRRRASRARPSAGRRKVRPNALPTKNFKRVCRSSQPP